jgi:hypothetical protein
MDMPVRTTRTQGIAAPNPQLFRNMIYAARLLSKMKYDLINWLFLTIIVKKYLK